MNNLDVVINGVRYIPAPPVCRNPELLDFEWDFPDAGGRVRIRDYLCTLLSKLWRVTSHFDGKKPFGNSGWEYELYAALIAAKAIEGHVNEYGQVEELTEDARDKAGLLVASLITAMCAGNSRE